MWNQHQKNDPPTASRRYTIEEIKEMQKIPEGAERPLTTAMTSKQLSIKEQLAQKDKELASLQQEEEKKSK